MTAIQPGQTYRSAKPRDKGFRIRIKAVRSETALAVSVDGGWALLNHVPLDQLHATETTRSGQPRRTGYVLEAGQ